MPCRRWHRSNETTGDTRRTAGSDLLAGLVRWVDAAKAPCRRRARRRALGEFAKLPCIRSLAFGGVSPAPRSCAAVRPSSYRWWAGTGETGRSSWTRAVAGAAAAVDVTLTPTCSPPNGDSAIAAMEIEGGCVTYRSSLVAGVGPVPSFDPGEGLSFVPRSQLAAFVERDEDLILCGAGAPCP